jgi:hypothetical protein
MGASLFRPRLYRKNMVERQNRGAVLRCYLNFTKFREEFPRERAGGPAGMVARITVVALLSLGTLTITFAQIAKRLPADKGPRALGLIELAANGKAHLLPVTIMINGRFYDAGVYKADPVPMALQSETVYEGLKSGVSQGVFTVSGAIPSKTGWVGDGKWRSNADLDADKAKSKAAAAKRAQSAPPPEQEIGGPPRLKRAPESSAPNPPSQTQPSAPPPPPASSEPSSTPAGATPPSPKTSPPEQHPASSSASIEDANRPVLRHQAPSETTHEQTKGGGDNEPRKGRVDFISAISDADGPEPRPYSYQMKANEEQAFLKTMLAMAADELRARASHLTQESTQKPAMATKKSKAGSSPEFHDTQLQVFDLSTSNEPVLVLTTQGKVSSAPDLEFIVALVARQDIYGDLHKVFAQTTDDQHLDLLPRYDLIDAVDVDGDGVGELLFRESWDSGTAFAVYRVIGDQLWPLFEGKPGT